LAGSGGSQTSRKRAAACADRAGREKNPGNGWPGAKAHAERSLDLVVTACVVLGGIRVTGGAGHVARTMLGIITVATLVAGMNSIASAWRHTVTGSVLVAVAILNEAASRWAARRAAAGP
jgi:ribose/xylose/arabinose/galactoside ABC-type transport system permease subunit